MSNDAESKKGRRTKPSPPRATDSTAAAVPHRRFLDAHRGYNRALQDAWEDAQSRGQDLYRRHLQTMQKVQSETQKNFQEAHGVYVRALQESLGKDDVQQRALEAGRTYQETLRQAHGSGQQSWDEAHREYQAAVEAAQGDYREQCRAAYRKYLGALKAGWAEIEVDALDAESLATLARSMAAAAHHAGQTLGGS